MTDPTVRAGESELVPGSFHALGGAKIEYAGPTESATQGCFKRTNGTHFICGYDLAIPWQDPKPSFVESRTDILTAIQMWKSYARRHDNTHVMLSFDEVDKLEAAVRALEPDAPDAAVAGSAEPVAWRYEDHSRGNTGYKVIHTNQEPDEASNWIRNIQPLYLAQPSPQPNPARRGAVPVREFEKWMATKWPDLPLGRDLSDSYIDSRTALRWAIWCQVPFSITVSAEFDEAAERKLFEKAFPEFRTGGYETELKVQGWLASARIDRRNK